jgi:hypothetical protein
MYFGTSTERLMMLLCSSVESSRASKAAEIGQRIFYSAQTFLDEKKVQSLSVNLTFCLPLRQQPLEKPNLRDLAKCLSRGWLVTPKLTKNDIIQGTGLLGRNDITRGQVTALACHRNKKKATLRN